MSKNLHNIHDQNPGPVLSLLFASLVVEETDFYMQGA